MMKQQRFKNCFPYRGNNSATSFGVPAIDTLLGGGLAVGSVCVFVDESGQFSKYFANCFASEGIMSQHDVFIAGVKDRQDFIEQLPAPVGEKAENSNDYKCENQKDILDETSSIAWRYKNLPKIDASISSNNQKLTGCQRSYSRKLKLDKNYSTNSEIQCCIPKLLQEKKSFYHDCFQKLQNMSQKFKLSTNNVSSNLLRILLLDLASPLYGDYQNVIKFLYYLKTTVRSSASCAVVTVDKNILDASLLSRIESYSDCCFLLKKMDQSIQTNKLYQNYEGIINIEKLPSLNNISFPMPDCLDLAFKWRKDVLIIEKLHTPPELHESDDAVARKSLETFLGGCSSSSVGSSNNSLDF